MADILAYAETRDGSLRPVAGEVVAAARKLADQLSGQAIAVVVGGPGCADAAADLARFGADRILVTEACSRRHPLPGVGAGEGSVGARRGTSRRGARIGSDRDRG